MIRLVTWCDEAAQQLGRALNDNALINTQREVEAGISQLWEVSDEKGVCGYTVTRLDKFPTGIEWCWVACGGRDFMRYARAFVAVAKSHNIPVRVHVKRIGMKRLYEKLGFEDSGEIIMRADHRVAYGNQQEFTH